MDDESFQQLSNIDDQLNQLCDWLNDKRDFDTASRLIPIVDDLTYLVAEISVRRKYSHMLRQRGRFLAI